MKRPTVRESTSTQSVFVSWVKFHPRSHDLAEALGAEPHFVAVGRPRSFTAPLRHPLQAVLTIGILVRLRPRLVYVMAPPLPLVLIALTYTRLTKGRLVIDAHSAAVVDRRSGRRLRGWFPPVARLAEVTIVTTDSLAAMLEARGVGAVALHDSVGSAAHAGDAGERSGRPRIVMPASWDSDEPMEVVAQMARSLPEVDVVITGHPRWGMRPRHHVPSNIELAGQLSADAFAHLLADTDAVLALTTAEQTMQRAGYEAVAYEKPLVTSDTVALRRYFTQGAVFVDPTDPNSLSAGVAMALQHRLELSKQMATLRRERSSDWNAGLATLKARLGIGAPSLG